MYGRQEMFKQTLVETPDEREHLEGLGMDGRIILKWILNKWNGEAWIELFCLRIGTGGKS